MDFSKLSSNEKLASIGAVVAIVGGVIGFGGAGSFGFLAAILMLVIVFLPQFSPSTTLPGSKGSLMVIVGGFAGIGALFALLAILPYLGSFGGALGGGWFFGLLAGIVGGLLMGWAGWKEFQAEGGKFNLGTTSGGSGGATTPPAPPAPPTAPPPPAPMAQPMAEPMHDPMTDPSGSGEEHQG
jgi:hypothetical protein